MKLISTTEYISELAFRLHKGEITYRDFSTLALFYVRFMKMDLKIGMFVPCDLGGNVLDDKSPMHKDFIGQTTGDSNDLMFAYQKKYIKAKERVLFEGFEVIKKGQFYMVAHKSDRESIKGSVMFKMLTQDRWTGSIIGINTLDDVANNLSRYFNHDFTLTPTAIKQIGL